MCLFVSTISIPAFNVCIHVDHVICRTPILPEIVDRIAAAIKMFTVSEFSMIFFLLLCRSPRVQLLMLLFRFVRRMIRRCRRLRSGLLLALPLTRYLTLLGNQSLAASHWIQRTQWLNGTMFCSVSCARAFPPPCHYVFCVRSLPPNWTQ